MKCPKCGTECETKFCPECGAPIQPPAYTAPAEQAKPKWYQSETAIVCALVFFFPLGIYLMWEYSGWKTKTKCLFTAPFVILMLSILIVQQTGVAKKKPYTAQTLAKETGVTEEKAQNWIDAYMSCGGDMEGFNNPTLLDDGRVGKTDLGTSYILFYDFDDSDKVTTIMCGTITFMRGGEVVDYYTNRLPDKGEINNATYLAKACIKEYLKNPSAAEFENIQVTKNGLIYSVTGTVRSTNSFNAMTSDKFSGEAIILENGDWNMYYMRVGEHVIVGK